MAESKEYTTLVSCTPKLEQLLQGIDRNVLHALHDKGLIGKTVYDDVMAPRSMLSEAQKAGEVVKDIKRVVSISSKKYGVLLDVFKLYTRECGDIIDILNDEYGGVPPSPHTGGNVSSIAAPPTGVAPPKVYESFNESMTVDEFCLWLQTKKQVPQNDVAIIKDKNIGGLAFKLVPVDKLKSYGVSEIGMMLLEYLKGEISPQPATQQPAQQQAAPQPSSIPPAQSIPASSFTPPHPAPASSQINIDLIDNSTLEMKDLHKISTTINDLSPDQVTELGQALGLYRRTLNRFTPSRIHGDMISAWLLQQDGVMEHGKTSWRTFARGLQQCGFNSCIRNIEQLTKGAGRTTTSPAGYTSRTVLNESHWGSLCEQLHSCAHQWNAIAMSLGFNPGEIANIQANFTNLTGGPPAFLRNVLSDYLHWAPGDARGSKDFATLEALKRAVDRAGFGTVALKLQLPNN